MLKFNVLTTAAMAALAAGIVIAQPAVAATQTVTSLGLPVPAGTEWGSLPGENTGGGDAYISSAAPRSGNGSLELVGDRTRVQTGVQYGGPGVATNLGLLSDVLSLVFDWQVAADSARQTYTPALRLMVQDGAQRSELIWEGAYNPGVGGLASANPTVPGTAPTAPMSSGSLPRVWAPMKMAACCSSTRSRTGRRATIIRMLPM